MPAGADPDFALALAKEVATIYGQAVDDILAMVARRLARGLDRPDWSTRKLLEQVELRNEAQAIIDRLEVLGPAAARRAIDEAWRVGGLEGARDLEVTGTLTPRTHTRAVEALARETVDGLQRTHVQILRTVDDVYRQVIAETSGVLTGTQTRRQAAQRALDRFADRGITGFTDSAGRSWSLDSYTEMATRTAAGRAQVAGTLDRFTAAGRDLVIVSDAPQECRLCLVPGTVVEGPVPTGASRSEYVGDVIRISTSSGKHLTGTPDHSVLTPFGWRRLQDLHPGDQVISDLGEHGIARVVPHDVQVPALIEDAAEAGAPILLAGPTRRDLDSGRAYREVHDVRADGDLLTERLASLGEPLRHLGLVGAVGARPAFLGQDDATAGLLGSGYASAGLVCCGDHGCTLLGGGVGPSLAHRLADHGGALLMGEGRHVVHDPAVAWTGFDSGSPQVVGHHPTADAEGGAELLRGLAGHVAADEILSIGRRQFRGHVWDLQTAPSWYVANGIVTHNCRPWEGRILSITGATPGYPTVGDATAAGLLHSNCRHSLGAYVEGLTRRFGRTADPEGDEARQEQRRLERGVRQWRRREVVALDEQAKRQAAAHARQWQARLRSHVAEHDLKRLRHRERLGAR